MNYACVVADVDNIWICGIDSHLRAEAARRRRTAWDRVSSINPRLAAVLTAPNQGGCGVTSASMLNDRVNAIPIGWRTDYGVRAIGIRYAGIGAAPYFIGCWKLVLLKNVIPLIRAVVPDPGV